jgi:hypothetical protein
LTERTGRRIAAGASAGIGGALALFDEGLLNALGWVALIVLVYAALARWVPPKTG